MINTSEEEVRKAFEYLKENGPKKQDELEEDLNLDDSQEVVRQLKNNSLAHYNGERRVEVTEDEFSHSDFKLFK